MSFLIPTPGGGKDSSLRLVWEILSAERSMGNTIRRKEIRQNTVERGEARKGSIMDFVYGFFEG